MKIEKIYIDLDGVLADFALGFKNKFGLDSWEYARVYGKNEFWNKVHQSKDLFRDLPKTKECYQLLALCQKVSPNICILTAPTKTNEQHCIQQKREWIDQHIGKDFPAIFTRDKYEYATPTSLLIDDTSKKVDKFIEAGGQAHLYKSLPGLMSYFEGLDLVRQ